MTTSIEILLAEDEEHIAKLVHFKLTKEGYQLSIAKNGLEAIELLEAKPWRLFLLDVMMPGADGFEVLKAIRSNPKISHIPVLMLTAKGFDKSVAEAAELGVEHFMKKPFDPQILANTVKQRIQDGMGK